MRAIRIRPDAPARVVAALTAAYSMTLTARPAVLAQPTGMSRPGGSTPVEVAELTRSLATRDAALALSLLLAPRGYPMLLLTAARLVSDAADAGWFARAMRQRGRAGAQVAKVSGVALGWSVLEAAAGWWSWRGRTVQLGG